MVDAFETSSATFKALSFSRRTLSGSSDGIDLDRAVHN